MYRLLENDGHNTPLTPLFIDIEQAQEWLCLEPHELELLREEGEVEDGNSTFWQEIAEPDAGVEDCDHRDENRKVRK